MSVGSAVSTRESAAAPSTAVVLRPPRTPGLIRHPKRDLLRAQIDWSAWYLSEEQDMGQSWLHDLISRMLAHLVERYLKEHHGGRGAVGANVFVQWVQGHPQVQVSPNVLVVDRLAEPMPKVLQLWMQDHLAPRFAVEVASDDWQKDYRDNPPKYVQLGCTELVIYDPEHDLHARTRERVALQVFHRTSDGLFVRTYAGSGPARSEELDGWLVVAGDGSRLLRIARDADGRDLVLTAEEALAAAEAEIAQLRAELSQRTPK